MARQRVAQQVNQFIGGINTEANPLNFPPNASFDEQNMQFNSDGSRSRRLGFDLEESYQITDSGIALDPTKTLARTQFRWSNVAGNSEDEILVVQIGNFIAMHLANELPISNTPIYTETFDVSTYDTPYGYAVVDGALVIGTGKKEISIYEYDGSSISVTTKSLLIRDLFGIEAVIDGVEVSSPLFLQTRPATELSRHNYNLRNQTFALPRVNEADTTTLIDPIDDFETTNSVFPSNADNLNQFLIADANKTSDRHVERFFSSTMGKTAPNNSAAPKGYFIIDALERGVSRRAEEAKLRANHPALGNIGNILPDDTTPGGPSVLAQYAGRVWYAGFSGEVVDGDNRSPRLSSYILFSQTVRDPSQINLCYQEADPTSNTDPELVDADGGFIKIDGAYGIKALIPLGTSLFVLAENGVWRVVGTDENSFSAVGYSVFKVAEDGCISGPSATVATNTLAFWGESAIYGIQANESGIWESVDLTEKTIQRLYDDISLPDKNASLGYYDEANRTIRWLYGAGLGAEEQSKELILNLQFSSFTRICVGTPDSGANILAVASSSQTTPGASVRGVTDAYYTVVTSQTPTISYSFGRYYKEDSKYDWESLGTPVDSPAYLLTGSVTGGDARLRKNTPYLTTYFHQADPLADNYIEPSCILSSRWDWTISATTGKWSTPKQAYRVLREDNAGGILATRNKIRGFGRSVAFYFESEPGKDLDIYGWEFNIEAATKE